MNVMVEEGKIRHKVIFGINGKEILTHRISFPEGYNNKGNLPSGKILRFFRMLEFFFIKTRFNGASTHAKL
jgi:hypothetical protein